MTIASQIAPAARQTVSGILPANGKMTPELIAKRRKLAEAMYESGIDTSPIGSPWQGAARMLNSALGGYDMYKADKAETEGRSGAREKLMKAMRGETKDYSDALSDPFMDSSGQSFLMNKMQQQSDPVYQQRNRQMEAQKTMRDSLPESERASFDADPDAYMKFFYEKKQAEANSGLFDQSIGAGTPPGAAAQGAPAPQSAPTGSPAVPASAPAEGAGVPSAGALVVPPEIMQAARVIARKDPGAAVKMVQDWKANAVKSAQEQKNTNFDDVSSLRKEIQDLPSYKTYSSALPTFETMIMASQDDSKAADLNLIYGIAKIYDPNSVVKEGETVMVKDTASLPDWLTGTINGLNGGARLQPDTRKALLRNAEMRIKTYQDNFEQNVSQFKGIAKNNNFNEADIMPIFPKTSAIPEVMQAAPVQPPPGAPPTDLYSKYGLKKVNP